MTFSESRSLTIKYVSNIIRRKLIYTTGRIEVWVIFFNVMAVEYNTAKRLMYIFYFVTTSSASYILLCLILRHMLCASNDYWENGSMNKVL